MNKKKIVVVEDEPDILEVLSYNLKREGFEVHGAHSGTIGLSLIRKEMPDLVLLDLMLPGMDGIQICKALKSDEETRHILIIMVTAKGEETDVVSGLGAGADDYISKPFSPREMVARVKAALRRADMFKKAETSESIVVDELIIDTVKHKVFNCGEEIKLTATEFRLLHFLASNSGRVFSRDQLISSAVGDGMVVVDRNIDVHVRALRKKLEADPPYIETIRGVGYRFREPV